MIQDLIFFFYLNDILQLKKKCQTAKILTNSKYLVDMKS